MLKVIKEHGMKIQFKNRTIQWVEDEWVGTRKPYRSNKVETKFTGNDKEAIKWLLEAI